MQVKGDAKVGQLDVAVLSRQDVGRLEITVDDLGYAMSVQH